MKKYLSFLLFAVIISLPCSALALNIQVTGVSPSVNPTSINYYGSNENVWAGRLLVNIEGLNDPGWAFCVDLSREINLAPAIYTYTPYQPPTTIQFRQAAWLINQYYSDSMTNAQAAALQAAIWEVVYRDHFTLLGPADVVTAYNLLSIPGETFDWAASNYVLLRVFDGEREVQTLITRVPEPMTMLLLGLGLIGLAGLRRKE